jgi:protein disulfide-isomerase A6
MLLGSLDATAHSSTGQEFGVQGYPTIKYFAPGSAEAEEYDGGRTADAIVKWAEEKFAENIPAPEAVEAVSEAVVAAACEEHPLCVIAFLPHILDCDAACRCLKRCCRMCGVVTFCPGTAISPT